MNLSAKKSYSDPDISVYQRSLAVKNLRASFFTLIPLSAVMLHTAESLATSATALSIVNNVVRVYGVYKGGVVTDLSHFLPT